MFKKLALVAIAAGIYLYTTSNKLMNGLEYSFSNLKYLKNSSNAFSTALYVDMTLENKTSVQATVGNVTGNTIYNGTPVGNFTIDKSFTIQPKTKVVVPVKLQFTNKTAVVNIITSIIRKNIPEILLKGNILTSIGRVPFSKAIV